MTAAAPTTPREVFPEVDVPARLIINKIDVRAEIPYLFTAASAAGSSAAAPYPDDYYRRERLPASTGGHDMSGGHAPSTGGNGWLGGIGGVIAALFVIWLLSYTPLWPGNWRGGAIEVAPAATPQYAGPAVAGPARTAPRRVIPPGTGQVTINREFDTGQEYCNKYVPGTTFTNWNGSGPNRSAHCVD